MRRIICFLSLALFLASCKKWDDHTEVTDQNLNLNLLQAIESESSLSVFRSYISKAGLDSVLQSSKTYTVWAPDNAALQSLDPAIVADAAQLRNFVLNHISNQSYFTRELTGTTNVMMLNGKYNNFTATQFDDATIKKADGYYRNGVLHIIDRPVLVLPRIWDFIESTVTTYQQNKFIKGLDFVSFDPSLAIIDSISSSTGLPVYQPGSGLVQRNRYNDRVYNLKNESRDYTYLVIADAGFTLESDSLKKYYASASTTTTDSLAKWNTVKDLAFEGYYPASSIPSLLVSKFGVPVPVAQNLIIESKRMSNGIVHILSKVDVITTNKFNTITIQGENPSGFSADRRGNTNYRLRYNPTTQTNFTDIMVTGHGVSAFYAYYNLPDLPSMKYRVYGFGVNDFQAAAFTQNIIPKYITPGSNPPAYTTLATFAHAVPLSTATGAYSEVLLGEFTTTGYGTVEVQLTASGTNPIVLDYLRIVPLP